MDNETLLFRENIDGWVKDINQKIDDVLELNTDVEETKDNTNHNYELIFELKDEIELLKNEIQKLKLIQLVYLTEKTQQEKRLIQ